MERNDPVQKLLALDNDSNLNMRYYDEDQICQWEDFQNQNFQNQAITATKQLKQRVQNVQYQNILFNQMRRQNLAQNKNNQKKLNQYQSMPVFGHQIAKQNIDFQLIDKIMVQSRKMIEKSEKIQQNKREKNLFSDQKVNKNRSITQLIQQKQQANNSLINLNINSNLPEKQKFEDQFKFIIEQNKQRQLLKKEQHQKNMKSQHLFQKKNYLNPQELNDLLFSNEKSKTQHRTLQQTENLSFQDSPFQKSKNFQQMKLANQKLIKQSFQQAQISLDFVQGRKLVIQNDLINQRKKKYSSQTNRAHQTDNMQQTSLVSNNSFTKQRPHTQSAHMNKPQNKIIINLNNFNNNNYNNNDNNYSNDDLLFKQVQSQQSKRVSQPTQISQNQQQFSQGSKGGFNRLHKNQINLKNLLQIKKDSEKQGGKNANLYFVNLMERNNQHLQLNSMILQKIKKMQNLNQNQKNNLARFHSAKVYPQAQQINDYINDHGSLARHQKDYFLKQQQDQYFRQEERASQNLISDSQIIQQQHMQNTGSSAIKSFQVTEEDRAQLQNQIMQEPTIIHIQNFENLENHDKNLQTQYSFISNNDKFI